MERQEQPGFGIRWLVCSAALYAMLWLLWDLSGFLARGAMLLMLALLLFVWMLISSVVLGAGAAPYAGLAATLLTPTGLGAILALVMPDRFLHQATSRE